MSDHASESMRDTAAADGLARSPPVIEAERLFAGGREVIIAHRGEPYRLRITQSGKLILTK